MKWALLLTIFTIKAFAGSIQLGFGSLTPHFGDGEKKNYCNQWNNTGIIANKTYYLRLTAKRLGMTYMRGNDSICSDIEGLFVHYIFIADKWWEMGMTVGGYSFEMKNWKEYAEKTPSGVASPTPVHTKFGSKDIVPVLALDVAIHLIRGDRWSLKLNNQFTPIIWNHSLAYEYRF
ncbi:MAG: hypothetical protein KC478_12955 [Bacteriovoracaceae bacterium]|nr:hypothetical protein [Bacteriovoracaceae bacterium]